MPAKRERHRHWRLHRRGQIRRRRARLTPRSAWLRTARGILQAGDLMLARLCALIAQRTGKGEGGQ